MEAKARKAAKMLGLSEAQYQDAKTNAKKEFETGKAPDSYDDSAENLGACINFVIMNTLCVRSNAPIQRRLDAFSCANIRKYGPRKPTS